MTNRQENIKKQVKKAYIDAMKLISESDLESIQNGLILTNSDDFQCKGIYQVALVAILEQLISNEESP